jgi:hypothetical protein
VALGLADLLVAGVLRVAADHDVFPRNHAEMEVGLGDRVERPGANDVVRLRAQVVGEDLRVPL